MTLWTVLIADLQSTTTGISNTRMYLGDSMPAYTLGGIRAQSMQPGSIYVVGNQKIVAE